MEEYGFRNRQKVLDEFGFRRKSEAEKSNPNIYDRTKTMLQNACSDEDFELAKKLLTRGADPNKVMEGDPPCIIAAQERNFRLLSLFVNDRSVNLQVRGGQKDSSYNILHAVTNPAHTSTFYPGKGRDYTIATYLCLELLMSSGRLDDATKKRLSATDTWVMALTLVTVFIVIYNRNDPDSCRDIGGLLVVFLCMDACFILRDHYPYRSLAAMIHWTEVVTVKFFRFLAIHACLIFGFIYAFYIQLHDKSTDNNDPNGGENSSANAFSDLTIMAKVLAMLTGELDYSGHPFGGLPFNYLAFLLFVFLMVIVLMNLLTGVAVNDVYEISNACADRAWYRLAKNISLWEMANIKLPFSRRITFLAFNQDTKLVCYPNSRYTRCKYIFASLKRFCCRPKGNNRNCNDGKRDERQNEIEVYEDSICDSAMKICLARISRMDEACKTEATSNEDPSNKIKTD